MITYSTSPSGRELCQVAFCPHPRWNATRHNLIISSLRTIASEDYPLSCRRKRRLCHCLCATVQRSCQDGNQSEHSDNNDKMTSQLSRARATTRSAADARLAITMRGMLNGRSVTPRQLASIWKCLATPGWS